MKMKKLQDMMKQMQRMQEQMEEEMLQSRFEATSGGGVVTVVVDGHKRLESVKIDPQVVDPEDVEILQDLIVAAVNEAGRKVDEKVANQLGGLTGGIPGLGI